MDLRATIRATTATPPTTANLRRGAADLEAGTRSRVDHDGQDETPMPSTRATRLWQHDFGNDERDAENQQQETQ